MSLSAEYDPLSTTFGEEPTPPWPTTPHSPHTLPPNLPRPSSRPTTPQPAGLYGKEPQIYGQPEPGLISPRVNTASNGTHFEKPEPYLRVRITGLDRNRRDILVKFDAQTNLSNFTGTTYRNVSRSYFEFQQFYESILQTTPQTIIPALPLAQTSAPTDEEDDRLVKVMLQRWLSRVCEDPILMSEEEVRSFIESDFGYQPAPIVKKKASSGFSLMRRGVPDEDEELQKARFELTKLEGQFFDAAKAIDKLSKARKTLATVRSEMGNKLVNVATTESHPPLGNAMRKLGRSYHTLSDIDQAQAISECVIIGDSFGYQGLNARSAKETLLQRTGVLEEYQAAVKTAISKRRNIERLRASGNIRPDRVDEAIEELNEAEKYERVLARRADGISQNLHRALDRHNRLVTDDVMSALIEHVRSSILYERQHLRELESLRNDVSNAAKPASQVKPVTPRPTVVPPLEDFSKPPMPRPASAQPHSASPAPSWRPPFPSTVAAGPPIHQPHPQVYSPSLPVSPVTPALTSATPSLPPASPAPSSPTTASLPPASPAPSVGRGPLASTPTLPPQPSSPGRIPPPVAQPSYTQPVSNGAPPLGGRLVEGTRSMFIKHTPSPLAASAPNSPLTPSKASAGFQSPLHTPYTPHTPFTPGVGSPHPLAQSMTASMETTASGGARGGNLANDLDPLGMAKPSYMSASVRVQPTRPRLDAREAASKLANMF